MYLADEGTYPDIWIDDQPESIGDTTAARWQQFVIRDDS